MELHEMTYICDLDPWIGRLHFLTIISPLHDLEGIGKAPIMTLLVGMVVHVKQTRF